MGGSTTKGLSGAPSNGARRRGGRTAVVVQRARILLVITLIIVVFALATGFPVFHRMYYIFGILLIVGAAWAWLLVRGVEVETRRTSLRTSAGQSIKERVTVRRKSRLLQGFLEIQENTDMPVSAPGAVIGLGSGDGESIELEVPCPQRGVFSLGPTSVSAADPLGLYRMSRESGERQRLVVHPETMELPGFVLLPADLPGEGPVRQRSQHVTTNAFTIRDYAFGDSLNRIAWKASARHNKLMVKEFEVEPANNIWVLVDMERAANMGPAGREIEETVVRVGASICRRYIEDGYPVGFLAEGNERFAIPAQRGSEHFLRIMDAFAEIRAHGAKPLLRLMADLHTRVGRYTSLAIVTPATDDDWLDGVLHLLQRNSRMTVVVVDGDPERAGLPGSASRVSSIGVPTYTIKAGDKTPESLIPLALGTGIRREMPTGAKVRV